MRLLLTLSHPRKRIPFAYQNELLKRIHLWLGEDNSWHDAHSNYCFSWLEAIAGGMNFSRGARWQISAIHADFINAIMNGITKDPDVIFGIQIKSIQRSYRYDLSEKQCYQCASPILLKDSGNKHITYLDGERADIQLTNSIRFRLDKFGYEHISHQVQARFRQNNSSKTKLVYINGIKNKASWCDIEVIAPVEIQQFIYDSGVGTSTGCGFGFLNI